MGFLVSFFSILVFVSFYFISFPLHFLLISYFILFNFFFFFFSIHLLFLSMISLHFERYLSSAISNKQTNKQKNGLSFLFLCCDLFVCVLFCFVLFCFV